MAVLDQDMTTVAAQVPTWIEPQSSSRKRKRCQDYQSDNQDIKQDGGPVTKMSKKHDSNGKRVSSKNMYRN